MVYCNSIRVYEGLWFKDKRHGKGMEIYSNGDRYEGDFSKGRPEGKGKRVWAATGEVYEGEWYQGMRHGVGTWNIDHKGQEEVISARTQDMIH